MQRSSRTVTAGWALGAALVAGGCATSTQKMSFGDAGFNLAEDAEVAPPVQNPAPEAVASEVPQGPPLDPVLLRFSSEARWRRSRAAQQRGFPREAIEAWHILAADLEQYLRRPLPQTPLLELVRARVTLEAEWDYDRRQYGPPPPALTSEVLGRAARLAARIDTVRAVGVALRAHPAPSRMRWPIEDGSLSSSFGVRADPFDGSRRVHRGIDLAAERGELVGAAARGWVIRAGRSGGYGLMVEIRHPGDVTTRYGHLSAILCEPGDPVDAGQGIGLVGQTGRATGPHLHFEVWSAGAATDPLDWIGDRVRVAETPPRRGSSGGPR